MELMNCRNCKKLFNYIAGEKLCPACKEKLEEKFQKVKKYIEENPRENINQVAEACDVTIKQIKYWVRRNVYPLPMILWLVWNVALRQDDPQRKIL